MSMRYFPVVLGGRERGAEEGGHSPVVCCGNV